MRNMRATLIAALVIFGILAYPQAMFIGSASAKETQAVDIGTARDIYDGSLFPEKAVRTYSNTEKIFPTRIIKAGGSRLPCR